MRLAHPSRTGVVAITCLMLAAPRAGAADSGRSPTAAPMPLVRDVALDDAGRLHGRALDGSLRPQAGKKITLWRDSQPVIELTTDSQGRFAVAGLRGGVYSLRSDEAVQSYRVWAPGTAPPHAEGAAVLVAQELIVRGQRPHPIYGILKDPLLLGVIVAAAIAIPIAIAAGDDDDAS